MPRLTPALRGSRTPAWLTAAWVPPAALAALATGYLAWGAWVSARRPSWLYAGSTWWREWLRPGHDGLLLAVTAGWLLSALLFWWPRRRKSRDTGLIIVVAMVVIGAVLGTASLAPCRGGQSRTAVTAWVLGLYVGNLEPRYGPGTTCPGQQLPLALQLARTVCLAATLAGALAATAVLWRQPVGRLRARLVRDATIITGLDRMTIPLLRCLTSSGPASHVVVIEPDHNHPLLDEVRETGAQVVVADPASPHVLGPLIRGLRGPQLRYLFALLPEAADNESVLRAARQVLSGSRTDPDRPPHLIARIDDPRHADAWRGERIGGSPLWFEDALSPQESTACALVSHLLGRQARRVVLCGDGALALAVLLELARRTWERGELTGGIADDGRPGGVAVLDRRARDLVREYLATSPPAIARALPGVTAVPGDWPGELLPYLDELTSAEAAETVVLITDTPSEASLHEAGRVARLHPATPVFVLTSDGAGVTGAIFDELRPFQRTLLVDGQVPEDSWTRIARHWHEIYRLAHPAAPDGVKKLTRMPWDELGAFFREDNILQLRSVMAAVVRQGRQWVPARSVVPGSFVELTGRQVEEVAREEHSRWYARRRQAGWRPPAAREADDDDARVNSNVRPWEDLPDQAREMNCRNVRSELTRLEAVGFVPVLPDTGAPGAAGFRRIGEIRAEQLAGRKTWRHRTGDKLSASPGDWQVVDDAGHERTIRDAEFRASHMRLNGNRWRRVGVVRAWRVSDPTVLRTIEGAVTAEPGDWIVQGTLGERWPVTDEQFRRGYQPAPAGLSGGPGRISCSS